jgi:hypothetical protein
MSTPFLVAALSGGLREGVGHVTLVSDETAIGGEPVQRASLLASIVRDEEQAVVIGDDYIGIRSESSVQASSGRPAPEALLLCNLHASRLSEARRQQIVEQMQARMDSIRELHDDCPARASRTVIPSPTLDRWLRLDGFDRLPPFRVDETPAVADRLPRSRWPLYVGLCLVAVATTAGGFFWRFSGWPPKNQHGGAVEPSLGQSTLVPATDKDIAVRADWYKGVERDIETPLNSASTDALPKLIDTVGDYEGNIDHWPDDDRKKACEKLQKILGDVRTKASQEVIQTLDVARNNLKSKGPSAQTVPDELRRLSQMIDQQNTIWHKIGVVDTLLTNILKNSSGTLRSEFQDANGQVSKLLIDLFDAKLNIALGVGEDSKDALDWLRTVHETSAGQYRALILNMEERKRISNGFDAVGEINKAGVSIVLLIVRADVKDKPVLQISTLSPITGMQVSPVAGIGRSFKPSDARYSFFVPLEALGQRGCVLLDESERNFKLPTAQDILDFQRGNAALLEIQELKKKSSDKPEVHLALHRKDSSLDSFAKSFSKLCRTRGDMPRQK